MTPIKKITVTNHAGETLELDFLHPSPAGLVVAAISGLGAPKANINMTDYAVIDGSLYNSARAQSRNIVITFQPIPQDMEANRLKVYKYFPIKKKIRLLIETNTRTCYIDGYVESCEANVYSARGRVSVSILCPDPYFREPGTTQQMYYRSTPRFEFPIGTAENPPPYELGELSNNYQVITIPYTGDADTGALLYLEMDGKVGDIVLTNSSTHEVMRIDAGRVGAMTGQAFGMGDAIQISTVPGNRYINLLRSGEAINIISALNRNSDWLTLAVGNNQFAYTATAGKENIVVRVEYAVAFVGV